ncbi:Myb_DNA-binding domain-containing protein/SWIRM domain-containing protein [Cephalotus follicularis]|uniref:Myb_DNA-binding domain-containing protein/SWIRM domain-containing protein n=1 Tax=Cephalotus follicularis TaxID=3775 RepID=A0A1Q3D092_CEPFO|nr:Myb_DNA-binding domain-containing protein/SWIRM domain-containing protein [Cephalotus follicularis]
MPASPSFPSGDGRGKWKRRKREQQQLLRKPKHEEEDDIVPQDDDLEENDDDFERENSAADDPNPDPNPNSTVPEVLDAGVHICDFPTVVRHAVNRPHASVLVLAAAEMANSSGDASGSKGQLQSCFDLENVSFGQLQALSAVPAETVGSDPDASVPYVIAPPHIMEGRGVVKRFGIRVHVVPMHSDWFSPATVHRLERQVVPHFFSGKSPDHTPEKYMECRNYIVAKYMENPEKRLGISDFQGFIDGVNNEDLTRIVRFLDHWGIINYCADAQKSENWNVGSYLREEQMGEVILPSAALKSIDSLIKFDKPKCRLKAADSYSSILRCDDDFSDLDNRIRERLSENRCCYCSQPLPVAYYQSQKEVDVLLCSDCFHEGRFVTGHSSIDFLRMDSTKDYGDLDGESWSDQETLLLLEAMEIYNENWNDVAEHVGTKSKAQCILHFVRLPMEDGLLENIEIPSMSKPLMLSNGDDCGRRYSNSNGNIAGSDLQDADVESRLPFANSGNPVMSLVAFLASAVGPRVAAACAHASLAALSDEVEGSGFVNRMNQESVHGREGGFHEEISKSNLQKEANSTVHGSTGQNEAEVSPLSAEKVKAAAKAGLAAAATKAKLFADHEEREIQRLSANIINHQLKRLELKLKQFAEVETLLMKECEQVERARQRFAAERARVVSARFGPPGVASQMNLPGVSPSIVNNNFGNNRQPGMAASPSQPSISGYSNNQTAQPQMPFMPPRQSMFTSGPRHPLGAMQASSSAPSNVMFNAPGNSQPAFNHPMLRSVSGTSSGLG